jgi:D-3-phosphoglycerate dehydrogenase
MYKIKTLNSISDAIYDFLKEDNYAISPEEATPDGILVRSADCLNMYFNPELRAIARAGAGVNNIPIDRCTQAGIPVFNTPGANANAVKEMVLGAMFLATRNTVDGIEWCRTLKGRGADVPKLVEKGKSQFVGHELAGKKIGVIGLGAIGVMVANDAQAIGMDVIGYDPFISVEHAWGLSRAVERALSLEYVLEQCDYITIHVPLMDSTIGFINEKALTHMKSTALLFNFARGEIVDAKAVINALSCGKLARYVTDFPTDDLLGAPGVICIPHLGASTPESEENCANMAARQLKDYLENGNIVNSVNLPNCEMPRSGVQRITMLHQNVANMVGQITTLLAAKNANIANMINKSRGSVAYTIIDLDDEVNGDVTAGLKSINGMIFVRIIK